MKWVYTGVNVQDRTWSRKHRTSDSQGCTPAGRPCSHGLQLFKVVTIWKSFCCLKNPVSTPPIYLLTRESSEFAKPFYFSSEQHDRLPENISQMIVQNALQTLPDYFISNFKKCKYWQSVLSFHFMYIIRSPKLF